MKITFLGTRGYIAATSKWHKKHTATLISFKRKKVLIDCGLDWLGSISSIKPDAIVLTHAHPDHAWGLREGSACPVYGNKETIKYIEEEFKIDKSLLNILIPYKPTPICGITFQMFPVTHSVIAPAVGYRITAGKVTIFYVPDLVFIEKRTEALRNIRLYIGNGATLKTPMIRKTKKGELFGHALVKAQLSWCQKENVSWAIITHCGSQIVEANKKKVSALVKKLGEEYEVKAEIAFDGMKLVLR